MPIQTTDCTRRDALRLGSLGLAAGVLGVPLGGCASSSRRGEMPTRNPMHRVARIAHFSDTHIQPELDAARGVAAALRHAQNDTDPPSLLITGGDLVMDAYAQPAERTREVFDLFTSVLRQECTIPVLHTLGNHDIWGWDRAKSGLTGNEALYGKAYALDRLGMASAYHATDTGTDGAGGWRVIVLDSIRPSREPGSVGYECFLDEAQLDWLTRTLEQTPKERWVLVVSHAPIVSASALVFKESPDGLRAATNLMHADAHRLHSLFRRHPNVRLALSGHMHEVDRTEHAGMTYICGGAVSGGWWKGPNKGCAEGYGVVDLFSDGTFAYAYREYGWQASATTPAQTRSAMHGAAPSVVRT